MNLIVVQLASGNAFFIGIGLTVIAFALRLWLNGRVWCLLTISWLVGISLVVLSATPMSFWLYGLWAWPLRHGVGCFHRSDYIPITGIHHRCLCFFSLSLCLTELPYRLVQRVTVFTNQPVFVLGDSISAGIGTKERVWPDVWRFIAFNSDQPCSPGRKR